MKTREEMIAEILEAMQAEHPLSEKGSLSRNLDAMAKLSNMSEAELAGAYTVAIMLKAKKTVTRIDALHKFCAEYHGKNLSTKLTEAEFDEVVEFCEKNEKLDHLKFERAVNRLYMDQKKKPKHWAIIQEILSCVNTRAKGATK